MNETLNLIYEDSEFYEIMKKKDIRTVFQPIVSLVDLCVVGYEALSRGPENSKLQNPELLLKMAEEYHMTFDLEWLFISKAIDNAAMKNINTKLFLNVSDKVSEDLKFKELFSSKCSETYNINSSNIVFEITERNIIEDMEKFKNTVEYYNLHNINIALDDVGAGYSGLNTICTLKPYYIKLDNKLIHNIDKDMVKQAMVKSLYDFSTNCNCMLIAEGIETEMELRTLINIGVKYGQGYFIQRPNEYIMEISDNLKKIIDDINNSKRQNHADNMTNILIGEIAKSTAYIEPKILVSKVDSIFKKNSDLLGLCVVEEGNVEGVITRHSLYSRLGWQYGYSIYSGKPISVIMETDFLQVDYKMSIKTVINLAMARPFENIYDHVTVTKNSKYYGIVTIKDLIERTMEIEVNNARYSNPLTGLPGNFVIEKELAECLNSSRDYCILYFDIDNFKAYNDIYGFENGDRIIKLLADAINKNISIKDFIGHIGGDDFISIIYSSDTETICDNIIKDFDELKVEYYDEKDLNKGYIKAQNRHGIEEKFPLVSLSIAGITKNEMKFDSIYSLAKESSRLKKKCKQIDGSCYIIV